MKKIMMFLFAFFITVGCMNTGMSNEEVAKQVEFCYSKGMYPLINRDGYSHRIVVVTCIPRHDARGMLKEEVYNEFIEELERRKVK